MAPPTAVSHAAPRLRLRSLLRSLPAQVVAAAVASLVATSLIWQSPSRVSSITVRNPTEYELFVSAGRPGSGTTMPLVIVRPGDTREVRDVVDMGDQWVLQFRSQGRDAGDLVLHRAELEAGGWFVTVPTSIGQALRNQGAPRPPQ
jgi:hypothetical protein